MLRHFTSWDPALDPDASRRGFTPPQTHRLWRDRLLPRIVIPLFWAYWVALLPAGLFRRAAPGDVRLGIESGRVGWTHVYFEELWASAAEYLGEDHLVRVVIDRDSPYLPQFRAWTSDRGLTHALVDVRTCAQTWPRALAQMLVVAWRLRRRRIAPIVVLTDASLRRHRLQAAVVTAFDGVVVTFMDASVVREMFPHGRLLGPMPMPVSAARVDQLARTRAGDGDVEHPTVSFIGGSYPPRTQFLEALQSALAGTGIQLRIHANKYETSNDDYWAVLATSDIILTTTMQGMPQSSMDWIWIEQLVFRFSEALSAGAVLVSPPVRGAERFFTPDADYATFHSVDDARDVLLRLANDPALRERLRAHGRTTASAMAREHTYWRTIDRALSRPLRA